MILSFRPHTIAACDDFVAVALPAPRRCPSWPIRRPSRVRCSSRRSSGSGPIERCSIHLGACAGARWLTSGSTKRSLADGLVSRGRWRQHRAGQSPRLTCISVTCWSSRREVLVATRCTHVLRTLTRGASSSFPPPRRWRPFRWRDTRLTCGARTNSLLSRTNGDSEFRLSVEWIALRIEHVRAWKNAW